MALILSTMDLVGGSCTGDPDRPTHGFTITITNTDITTFTTSCITVSAGVIQFLFIYLFFL
jgi:hypothetical protein